ncbi:MAG: hypothetical protein KA314_06965 [Chloroflexi bacterium]|nr:hypothetical protein [Chloroflexota bacterium]MBP8055566.1 hypothetical protein [Chloroflexota bacterium]
MSNLFDDFDFDEDEPAPAPDWLREMDDERGDKAPPAAAPPPAPAPPASTGIDLDRLRQKSARAVAMDDEMASDAPASANSPENDGSSNFFSRMTPPQRLIIALFFVVDLCLVGVGLLLVTGAL